MNRLARYSLALWFALLFSFVAACVFAVAGFHLYRSLNEQLQRRDDLALVGTAEIMRTQLSRTSRVEAAHLVINLVDAAYGPSGITLALRDAAGNVIAASAPEVEKAPVDDPVPAGRVVTLDDVRDWFESGVKRGRFIVAVQENGSKEPTVLTVARNDSHSGVVLDAHGHDVLLTLFLGVLATGALGYLAVKRALQPMTTLVRAAEHVTATELSERLSAESGPLEVQVLVRAFNQMLDRLEDSFRRLSQFSSDIAHDLRTPLSNLMIANQVSLNKPRTVAEYQNILVSNIEEFERLSRMIDDMLFLAKAEHPETVITRTSIELRDDVDKVVEFYTPLAEEKRLSITCSGAARVEGNRRLLQRAIHNLLSNAIRYSAPGSNIDLAITMSPSGCAELSVTNRGAGITATDLPYIFDRFYRADAARERSSDGSGLGLAIVKSIATLHGGQLTATSVPGECTTFVFTLPAAT